MADHSLFILSEAHVEFEAVAAIGQGLVEGGKCILRDRLDGAGASMAEKKRAGGARGINQDRNLEWACPYRGSLSPSSRPPGISSPRETKRSSGLTAEARRGG